MQTFVSPVTVKVVQEEDYDRSMINRFRILIPLAISDLIVTEIEEPIAVLEFNEAVLKSSKAGKYDLKAGPVNETPDDSSSVGDWDESDARSDDEPDESNSNCTEEFSINPQLVESNSNRSVGMIESFPSEGA
ncbi:hypothetical protein L1887_13709 [Cichorium endivia]|nr:hypothetical protein L1887_13709 [Cichorium endivia]